MTGNQPSCTPNSEISTVAVTNAGTEVANVVPATTAESVRPPRTAASTPSAIPNTTNSTEA